MLWILFVHFSYLFFNNFVYLLVVLGLASQSQVADFRCMGFSLVAVIRSSCLVAVHGLLIVVASLVVEHRH